MPRGIDGATGKTGVPRLCLLPDKTCPRQLLSDMRRAASHLLCGAKKQTLPRCGGDEGRENDMAIYHWESKVITRGEGRTACGAAAYMSCSRLYNDYDGIQHDYTRKGGLVWEHIFLPTMAPAE